MHDQFIANIDLDRTFVHFDLNKDKVEKLLREHAGGVELESFPGSNVKVFTPFQ